MCRTPSIRMRPACMCRRRVSLKICVTLPPPEFRRPAAGKIFRSRPRFCRISPRGAVIGTLRVLRSRRRLHGRLPVEENTRRCWRRSRFCATSTGPSISTSPMNPIPGAVQKTRAGLIDSNMGIVWTTQHAVRERAAGGSGLAGRQGERLQSISTSATSRAMSGC